MNQPTIEPIPAFTDNYIWAISIHNELCVVDPGDALPVINYAKQHQLTLDTILITHHHNDHIGGVEKLRQQWPDVQIYGPQTCIKPHDTLMKHGDVVHWKDLSFRVFAVPGHTLDHIAYFSDDAVFAQPMLFCGDTLFAGGCGRLFEGTPEQMFTSLQLIAALPDSTLVYCAHEYTLSNLRFAQTVDPDNKALQKRITHDSQLRENYQPTIPSSLEIELATNPFLRCHTSAIRNAAAQFNGASNNNENNASDENEKSIAAFAAIREWKNRF
jgi:hydroxyacylglutathione hydrolase